VAAARLHPAPAEAIRGVWCAAEARQTYAVWTACFDGDSWSAPVRVTPRAGWVPRPEVALAPGGSWVTWLAARRAQAA
jgi:hypothetical protein